MLRTLLLLTVIPLIATPGASHAMSEEILPAGMLLQCSLDEPNFSSRTAEIGDPVLCHLGAVLDFGHSIFPRGAYLAGRFQEYRDPGRLFGKGWIELTFDHLLLPGAVTVPVSVKVISVPRLKVNREGKIQGGGHPKRDAVGWIIPVLWPVKILTLPARGPRPTLKGEMRITLRLLDDVQVPTMAINSRTESWTPENLGLKPSNRSSPSQQSVDGGSSQPSLPGATVTTVPTQKQSDALMSNYFAEDRVSPELSWLILQDGTSYLVRDYWFQFGKLHYVTLDGDRKAFPLSLLDLDETIRLNRERNVTFVIRGQQK